MNTTATPAAPERLERSIQELTHAVKDFSHASDSAFRPRRALYYAFLKGVLYGFGFLVGFAVIIPLFLALLRSIDWVPLVGRFVHDVEVQVEKLQDGGVKR